MSLTRSSALTFFSWITRIETSWGFSVSSRSISRFTSGNLDFCAATIRRLETLSGQIRTGCVPGGAAPPGGCGPPGGGCGGWLGGSGEGTPPTKRVMFPEGSRLTELDEEDRLEEGGVGVVGCEFKISVSRLPNSSASEYFRE